MKCPKCQTENPETRKFCLECAAKLVLVCAQCGTENLPPDKFCGECGQTLEKKDVTVRIEPSIEGERKQVTALFSDLSGYTAMTEKLDPEEVKEIMGRIFGEIISVVNKYDGCIEKFIGDAIVALFGVPKAHEDDPVRAIRAAREIHEIVDAVSPRFESRVGKRLSMHTGINTGLVVTGEVTMERGALGVTGDTVNVASRLSGIAEPGEILVGEDTYRQAEGLFNFAPLTPVSVKGKAEPIRACRVLSPKEEPTKTHRLSGLRSELIGRKVEMSQLKEAAQRLLEGKGAIFYITGDAGTGKSRLIEEFKATLDLNRIQWREGHSYAYASNIPYFPLMELLSRVWQIEEGDSQERLKQKIEAGITNLMGDGKDVIPFIGSLYSIKYPEIENISPEYWKMKLHESIQSIVSALTRRAPAVICLEDLHWTDPSSIELLRTILLKFNYPALFLCVSRPQFSLFTSQQLSGIGKFYYEVRLQDLSPTEAQGMVESLLKTETIPAELRNFIQRKAEGNPFYLEEVINSLIETETLIEKGNTWVLTRPLAGIDIPSNVQGVISARLDRLEKETKRILQEASVIGRAFLYEILKRITELKEQIDRSLQGLERLDLIRTRTLDPDLEYIFKHALTQEVVYNGLLKKERQVIHEKIANVMEELFRERLPEFYETLAYHYKQGQSHLKAVDYLMKAGEKCYERYTIEESHQYYKEAFDILSNKTDRSKDEDILLIDLLIQWSSVYYLRGDMAGLEGLLKSHEAWVSSLGDEARLGMFHAWRGGSFFWKEKYHESYRHLSHALEIGKRINNSKIIGYSSCWLTQTCSNLGLFDEALACGRRSQEISEMMPSDRTLFRMTFHGMAVHHCCRGEKKGAAECGRILLDYGEKHADVRATGMGHQALGMGFLAAGDHDRAIECFKKAIQVSVDPFFQYSAKGMLGFSYVSTGRFHEAESVCEDVIKFTEEFGFEWVGSAAQGLMGIVMITKGDVARGINIVESIIRQLLENGSRWKYAVANHMLGRVYSQIAQGGGGEKSISFLLKNIGFLIKTVPFATRKAEGYFQTAIETAKDMGAKSVLGQAYLDLGKLHKAKGRLADARTCISQAVQSFEECEADVYLKQARDALVSLG
jgi:class 3 adenylate cyclase/tetratricopeptide (TPR) repeat protein